MTRRQIADQLLNCMEFQMISNRGQDTVVIKTLYKFFLKGIIQSDAFFENFVDRREFFNQLILVPLNEIGIGLKNPTSDNMADILKRATTLMTITMVWVSKTAIIRNAHAFTLNVLDNDCLVALIQTFSQFEVEQYLTLFERYSRSPKSLRLNLELYSMLCLLLRTLVNCMTHFFVLPRDEIVNSRVFSLTISSFLQVMTEQLNVFIITRSLEMHKFTNQLVLIYDFLGFLSTMM